MSFINSKLITSFIFALGAILLFTIWLTGIGRYTQPTVDQKNNISRFFEAANPLSLDKIYTADFIGKLKQKYDETKHPQLKSLVEALLSDKAKDHIKSFVEKTGKLKGSLGTNILGDKTTIDLIIFDPFCSGDILQLTDANGVQQIAPKDRVVSISIATAIQSGELRFTGIKDTQNNGIGFAAMSKDGAFLLPIVDEGQTISLRVN